MRNIPNVIQTIKSGDFSSLQGLSEEEKYIIKIIANDLATNGKSSLLESLYESDYDEIPVSIDEFLDSSNYLGNIGMSIFSKWREELRNFFSGTRIINEIILRGSVGGGKTSIAVISLMYRLHEILCLKNPQKTLGQIDSSPIVLGFFNIHKYLARSTAYTLFNSWMKLSPFLSKFLPRKGGDQFKNEYIDLDKGVTIALGSSAIHALSQNLLFGLLDEADMGREKSISDFEKSQIQDLYQQGKTRMVSRFQQSGGYNPGLFLLVSQVRDTDAFLSQHVEKVKNDNNTYICGYSLWDLKEHIYKNDRKFRVVIGNKMVRSYILEDGKKQPENLTTIEVPISLRPRFEYNLDSAIRDIAGIPTYGYRLFLPRRDRLFDCYKASTIRKSPFTRNLIELSIDDDVKITDYFDKQLVVIKTGLKSYRPMMYPNSPRAIHIDLAKNKDHAGIACGCLGAIRSVEKFDNEGMLYLVKDYSIFIDFTLEIRAKYGSEIDYSKIRQFVFFLKTIGYPVKYISMDQYQSVDSQQQFKKAKFQVEQISVDKTTDPYYCLRGVIMELLLDIIEDDNVTSQLTLLQDLSDVKGVSPKIDHPRGGKKDVADSLCGVVYRLCKEKLNIVVDPNVLKNTVENVVKTLLDQEVPMQRTVENPLERFFK